MSRQTYAVCLKCLFSLVLLLVIVLPALGQSSSTASITGIVQDSSEARIPNAKLKLINTQTGTESASKTNGDGNFVLPNVMPGSYTLQIERDGFETTQLTGITLNVGDTKNLLIRMKVGSAQQTVTVDASGLTINTTDASVSTVVDSKFVETMPLNGRSFQDLISMTPGVLTISPQAVGQNVGLYGDFSVNGQRTESNYYTVDGVSANVSAGNPSGAGQAATTGSISASTALGTTQALVSVDALQEFRVSSSTYSAEYGRSPGGQFSFATRSGTNDFHGTAYDYLRNDFFDANDWFNDHSGVRKPALRQNDFGGTVGGPVILPRLYDGRNKTFLFFSYEGLRLVQPTAASNQYVPSLAVRASAAPNMQAILNAYPLPTGPELTDSSGNLLGLSPFSMAYSLPGQIDSTSIRLDETISPKLTVFFRYSYNPSHLDTRTLSQVNASNFNTSTYTFGASSQLSSHNSNEFRFGYDSSNSFIIGSLDTFGGAQPTNLNSAIGIPGTFTSTQAESYISVTGAGAAIISTLNRGNTLSQWNVTDTHSYQVGAHQLRFGIDERRIHSPLTPTEITAYADIYTRQNMTSGTIGDLYISHTLPATPIFNEFAAFVQDEWHLTKSLNASLGLRWEVNPPPSEANGNLPYTLTGNIAAPASLALAPQGTPLWKTSWYNFAPRLGLAWTVRSISGWETVVRSGGGAFFDTGNQVATGGFNALGFNATADPTNVSLPAASSQFNLPTTPVAPYTRSAVYAYPTHLQLPYTLEWNVSVQQELGKAQSLTTSYVASNGRRLLQEQQSFVLAVNPNFATIYYFPNRVTSNYQSLQLQFQRSVSRGVQALASYAWSHSLDYGSTNSTYALIRGNSDFDVRHNLQGGLAWDIQTPNENKFLDALSKGWGIDCRIIARTGFPLTLTGNVLRDPVTGIQQYSGVNLIAGQPIYVYGSQYPGGRAVNRAAFALPASTNQGNAPRNFVRGFGEKQINVAARRAFRMTDKSNLQFRAEAFNIFNHPNFGFVQTTLSQALFGQATTMLNHSLGTVSSLYQQGGPRSMQFSLKLTY